MRSCTSWLKPQAQNQRRARELFSASSHTRNLPSRGHAHARAPERPDERRQHHAQALGGVALRGACAGAQTKRDVRAAGHPRRQGRQPATVTATDAASLCAVAT
eukprot:180814-Chlamydomonas_euryale.AAC.1